jgi:hypothetical protein
LGAKVKSKGQQQKNLRKEGKKGIVRREEKVHGQSSCSRTLAFVTAKGALLLGLAYFNSRSALNNDETGNSAA